MLFDRKRKYSRKNKKGGALPVPAPVQVPVQAPVQAPVLAAAAPVHGG